MKFIPIEDKYLLSIKEAAVYFNMSEYKIYDIINKNKNSKFLLKNGNRILIKKRLFDQYINGLPLDQRDTLTIEEAAIYFDIRQNNIKKLINQNKTEDFVIWENDVVLIKRVAFEKFIDKIHSI